MPTYHSCVADELAEIKQRKSAKNRRTNKQTSRQAKKEKSVCCGVRKHALYMWQRARICQPTSMDTNEMYNMSMVRSVLRNRIARIHSTKMIISFVRACNCVQCDVWLFIWSVFIFGKYYYVDADEWRHTLALTDTPYCAEMCAYFSGISWLWVALGGVVLCCFSCCCLVVVLLFDFLFWFFSYIQLRWFHSTLLVIIKKNTIYHSDFDLVRQRDISYHQVEFS